MKDEMPTSNIGTSELRHGSEWIDHEDCIVGNEAGLTRLREACDVALREGEYFGNDLGEFVGVKRLDSSWFKNPKDAKSTRMANAAFGAVLLVILCLIVLGAITAIRWLV
jgi:hypothetical protein